MQSNILKLAATLIWLLAGLTGSTYLHAVEPASRIVGGKTIDIAQASGTVALLHRARVELDGDLFQAQFCGGTVIATRWIITAAHCLSDPQTGQKRSNAVMVLMNSGDLGNPTTQPVSVTRIIIHENFTRTIDGDDIALLEIESDALVTPVALDGHAVLFNDPAYIAGWGAIDPETPGAQQSFPQKLRGAHVRMIPGESCSQAFIDYRGLTDSDTICAGLPGGGVDTCQGDSGGPLYRLSVDQTQAVSIAGITSWGISCAQVGSPGVYTSVYAYLGWIQDRVDGVSISDSASQPLNDSGTDVFTDKFPDATQTPVNDPDNLPGSQSEPATVTLDNDDSFLGAGGACTLALLASIAFMRRFAVRSESCSQNDSGSRKLNVHSAAAALLSGMVGIQSVHAAEDNQLELSLVQQPIGEERESVITDASEKFGAEPVCTTVRTGYGMTKRAYFLEVCTFANTAGYSLYRSIPSVVEFRFLEDRLVQVAFEFDEILDGTHFRNGIRKQNEELVANTDSALGVASDENFRTTVSELESVNQIHLMRKSP
ncbi:MAG: serine protease [Granulosicoccus sp.]